MILSIVLVTAGYLMGSICSAVIVCRMFNLPDPREQGSKNPGATNVLRIAGKKYAAIVMLADLLKGTIPVVIAKSLGLSPTAAAFVGLAAVIGHMYPLFFEFKGGKGVATALGALLGFNLIVGALVAGTWLLMARFFRYSSLASIVSITLSPLFALLVVPQIGIFPPLLFMAILIVFKHLNNITRLMDGTEPKIKLKQNMLKDIVEAPSVIPETTHEKPIFAEDAREITEEFGQKATEQQSETSKESKE
ncbi:MAG: glycerol-3-phosphate 1-O-acyltransferase PlsY [Legionella sp.]